MNDSYDSYCFGEIASRRLLIAFRTHLAACYIVQGTRYTMRHIVMYTGLKWKRFPVLGCQKSLATWTGHWCGSSKGSPNFEVQSPSSLSQNSEPKSSLLDQRSQWQTFRSSHKFRLSPPGNRFDSNG